MKKRIIVLGIILINLLILGLIYYGIKREEDLDIITLYGNVDVREVDISFRVGGRVEALYFEEGDLVKEGDLLSSLDLTPYDSELEERISHAKAIEAEFENSKILLQRRQELIGCGAVSQEELDRACMEYQRLSSLLEEAKSSVKVAEDRLSYTEAYAPNDGIILTRVREPGSIVQPSDAVYTLSITAPVWIRAFLDEPDLGAIYYGMEGEVFTDIKGGKSYKGKVGFISPIAEFTPKTVETTELRTDLVYRLRIYVEEPDEHLVQGMPVTVKLRRSK